MFKVGCDKCGLESPPDATGLADLGWIFFKTRMPNETKAKRRAVCSRECLAGFFRLHEGVECTAVNANWATVDSIREDLVRVADERNAIMKERDRLHAEASRLALALAAREATAREAKRAAYAECAEICDSEGCAGVVRLIRDKTKTL